MTTTLYNSQSVDTVLEASTLDFPMYIRHKRVRTWIQDMVALCKPDSVYFCDGSQEEYDELCQALVNQGTFTRLNDDLRPNSFLAIGRFHAHDEHVFGQPAFIAGNIRRDSQGEAFLAQQGVAAVTAAIRPD